MASSYEHLVAAEELLQTAHGLLQSGKRRRAAPLIRLASGFLEAATILRPDHSRTTSSLANTGTGA
ncbi:hypothetical protein Shyd_83040 [Streptomyces hydrogenans]|uniref:Uncharacterized protein n=1 Tax=Streptomyces hydrogenans TaxID=1873719 RepID=A0ABQ3PPI3_9ACTN|nr:hypothetical protein Shyd_83040 [Streptomyces hydrogenans]